MTSIATVRAPDASADAMPDARVLDRDAVARCRRRAAGAAVRYGSGSGLAGVTSSPVTTTSNRPGRRGERLGEHAEGRGDQRHRHAAACRSARICWAPGCHGIPAATPSATRPLRKSTISSSGRSTPRSLEPRGRDQHRVAHQRQAVLVRPDAAVRLDELGLGGHPVGLGVDERAVHVPQDGGGQDEVGEGAGHRSIVRGGAARRRRVRPPRRAAADARGGPSAAVATSRPTLGG